MDLLGRKRKRRQQELAERIRVLQEWHRIFDEWKVLGYDVAAEMAQQGISYISMMVRRYYLPTITAMLNDRSLLLEANPE